MASIFNLNTNVSELSSSNEGTSRMMYEQHPPTRDVTGDNFPNGAIHTRFQTSGQKWWVPSRSYMRMRAKLTKEDGATTLDVANDVAPNMGLMANLFQSGEFRIAGTSTSRVSDYMPQIDALETRLSKSKSWLDSVGSVVNWWDAEAKERQNQVVNNPQSVKVEVAAPRLELGIDPATTFAIAVDTGVATQATGTLIDLSTIFVAGDILEITTPLGLVRYSVVNVPTPNTLQLDANKTLAVVAGVYPWSRIRKEANAGQSERKLNTFEMIWQPPLSIFKIGHALPSGAYELVLNPQTVSQYKKRAIESILGDKTPGALNSYDFEVVDMYLLVATVEGPRADDLTYLLDLEETRCQVDDISNGGSFQQKNFDVSPSTFALTACFQDSRAGSLTQYSASKFKIDGDNSDELKLNRMFLNYAGQNRPAPDADPEFKAGRDYTVQRYAETQLYSGAYYDCGGAETIEEWHDRGAYYYFSWPRDGTDRSTRVNAHFGFEGSAVANGRVLLFDHSKKIARVEVRDGRVVSVQIEDA